MYPGLAQAPSGKDYNNLALCYNLRLYILQGFGFDIAGDIVEKDIEHNNILAKDTRHKMRRGFDTRQGCIKYFDYNSHRLPYIAKNM